MLRRYVSWLAGGALALVLGGVAGAEVTTLAPLLEPLDLRGYAAGTAHRGAAGRAGPAAGGAVIRVRVGLRVIGLILMFCGLMDGEVAAQPQRLIRIGALTESWGPTPAIVGLREGLKELGYRENEDFVIGVRFTQGDPAELPRAASELVRHGVDVIVTSEAGNAAKAGKAVTSRIPIVFIGGIDPVELGLVRS